MDIISQELQEFLIRLGKDPECADEKTVHYVKHILHLLSTDDEFAIEMYYGLFGIETHPLDDIASRRSLSTAQMMSVIEAALRKLAITPEWQMVKQLINKK